MTPHLKLSLSIGLILSLVLLFGLPKLRAQKGLLDGRIFVGEFNEMHIGAANDDTIRFVNGELDSRFFTSKDFTAGVYTAILKPDGIYFEAVTVSQAQGAIKWRGIVRGDAMEVNYQWRQKGWLADTVRDYAFKGKLKK